MNAKMTRLCFSLMLIIMGGMCVMYYATALIVHYVNPNFQVATLLGGLGMLVVGAFLLFTVNREAGCGHDHSHDDGGEHDHEHSDIHPMVALFIIALPLGISLSMTEHKPSSKMLDRKSEAELNPNQSMDRIAEELRPVFSLEMLERVKEKNGNGAYKMQISELFYSAGDPEVAKIYEGLSVEVMGQVRSQPGEETDKTVKRLYRMFVTCCATDMQPWPVKLKLEDELAKQFSYADHAWILVEGEMGYELDEDGIKRAVILVKSMEATTEPRNAFLSSGG